MDITILPEISTEGMERCDVNNLMETVRTAMCKEYEKKAD